MRSGANSLSGCANLLFCKFFGENYMKMKEFGPQRRRGSSLAPPPFGSANELLKHPTCLTVLEQDGILD